MRTVYVPSNAISLATGRTSNENTHDPSMHPMRFVQAMPVSLDQSQSWSEGTSSHNNICSNFIVQGAVLTESPESSANQGQQSSAISTSASGAAFGYLGNGSKMVSFQPIHDSLNENTLAKVVSYDMCRRLDASSRLTVSSRCHWLHAKTISLRFHRPQSP